MTAWADFENWLSNASSTIATGGAASPAGSVEGNPGMPTKAGLETTADTIAGGIKQAASVPGNILDYGKNLISDVKWTVVLIIAGVLFVAYIFAKNSKISKIV